MPLYAAPNGALPVPSVLIPPMYDVAVAGGAWPAANRAIFNRFQLAVPTPIRYVDWIVTAASGNVQLGVVSLVGADRTSYNRLVHTGVIACPAAGNIRTDLGLTMLPAGDLAMFMWADNTTFQTRYSSASGHLALRHMASHSGLASGVAATGIFTWDSGFVNMALEGDV